VRGVTLIDYDHVRVLGSTLEQIAWEKGGIYVVDKMNNIGSDDGGYESFVSGGGRRSRRFVEEEEEEGYRHPSFVFAAGTNTPGVLKMLQCIAEDNGSRLSVIRVDDEDGIGGQSSTLLLDDVGLHGDHQRGNAALALAMCRYAEVCRPDLMQRRRRRGSSMSDAASYAAAREGDVRRALSTSFWPGRCHTVHLADPKRDDDDDDDHDDLGGTSRWRPSITLRCDGAHTPISMDACVRWFREVTNATEMAMESDDAHPQSGGDTRTNVVVKRALIFNCGHERNPIPLLFCLCRSGMFDSVYFCHADSERPSAVPKELEDGWTREPLPLAVPNDPSVESTTWKGMQDSLSTTADVDRGQDGFPDDVVAAGSLSSWQELLGCLWRVMDAYLRRHVGGRTSALSSSSVAMGLSVKDAIASIRKDAARWAATIGDDETVNAERKELSIEVCVTGSLYIVGSALSAAGCEEGDGSS
jgi:folylpolyglutamate synthase/dihydropteroate synthase